MRWKLLRRRLSIAAPRVIVRRHLPWPLRWAAAALTLGFSAAIALWAFELGKDIAGLDQQDKSELVRLRAEFAGLREARDKARSFALTADSLLKAERAAQDKLIQQLHKLELEHMALTADLGFFERLLPASQAEGVEIRAAQLDVYEPGRLRYQVLVMQSGKSPPEFKGRFDLALQGVLDGRPWSMTVKLPDAALLLRQYARLDGQVDVPKAAVVKTLQVKIIDSSGAVRATHTARP